MIGHAKELIATRKSGETFPASISFSVANVHGKLFFTGIVRDLTETKALEEQISKSERLAALGQVVAEITHEIKNPLALIGGFARQMIRKTEGHQDLSKLNVIAEEVKRLEKLLSDLREFYLPRNLTLEQVEINGVLQELYDLIKDNCDGKNIRLELKTAADAGLVEVDRGKLKQVLMNLLKNAIEAMDHGGSISIQSRLSKHNVDVTIADDGPGISKDDQEKIFNPFFTTKRHGTGLGLSVCKRIMEDHEGCTFSFTSEEGKGTDLTISLPPAPSPITE
jgi:signal transduction histidine kinase